MHGFIHTDEPLTEAVVFERVEIRPDKRVPVTGALILSPGGLFIPSAAEKAGDELRIYCVQPFPAGSPGKTAILIAHKDGAEVLASSASLVW